MLDAQKRIWGRVGLLDTRGRIFWSSSHGILGLTESQISFTTPPSLSNGFASPHALQYHSRLPSLHHLVEFAQGSLCGTIAECRDRASSLLSADSIDINFDGLSRSLTVTGLWSSSPNGGWTEEIRSRDAGPEKTEVGILGCEKVAEYEELKAGGLLSVVGEDEKLSMPPAPSCLLVLTAFSVQNRLSSRSHLAIIPSRTMRLIPSHSPRQPECIRR